MSSKIYSGFLYASYQIALGDDKTINSRTVYSLMSFLGDIGGFQSSFFTLGLILNSIVLARYPAATILEQQFKVVPSRYDSAKQRPSATSSQAERAKWLKHARQEPRVSLLEHLRHASPLVKLLLCICPRSRRQRKVQRLIRRTEQELDSALDVRSLI